MAKRKRLDLPPEINKIIFGIIFLILGASTAFADTNSVFGNYLSTSFIYLFGEYFKLIVSPAFLMFSFLLFKNGITFNFNIYRVFGFLFYFSSICTIIGYFTEYQAVFNIYNTVNGFLGVKTTLLAFFTLFIISLVILFRFSPKTFIKKAVSMKPDLSKLKTNITKEVVKDVKEIKEEFKKTKKEGEIEKKKKELDDALALLKKEKEAIANKQQKIPLEKEFPKKIAIEKVEKIGESITDFFAGKKDKKTEDKEFHEPDFGKWELPKINLLHNRGGEIKIDENEVKRKELEIEEKLLQFKIEVDMEGYKVGPTVTQYRLKPAEGVKLQKIENLKKDLTLALQAKSIRIQAPIPGLGVVGIETPNNERSTVGLREVLESPLFKSQKNEIPIAIGKDVNADMIIGDLVKMPHLLVAGQTASGKSVGVNGFIISMLYKFSPRELKFIMVDPKRVELSIYNGIPHLLTPVITSPDKAVNALKRGVAEMLKRYDLATAVNAKNIKEYNEKVDNSKKWPYIVIIIDELADLMMSGNKKEVEQSIARLAQMARAVGMHLIVATQRPSVDVITGLIKANIPSRIAFTVASQVDSRTVLDKAGAEDLLGRGDMLYSPTGTLEPERVQGVFVDTDEIEAVVNQIKLTVDPDVIENMYDPNIVSGRTNSEGSIMERYEGDQDENPEIVEKAIQVVKEAHKASTSLIQRKLGLGYARAAKILDILEDLGVVGPSNGSKPREVYVD
ncbi:MAG: DNA translocase FtsK [Candidatus Gracilibacteria bacterium]|nr:DNA translocase FtsK [Candidatus Gracilibacteria bacterium]